MEESQPTYTLLYYISLFRSVWLALHCYEITEILSYRKASEHNLPIDPKCPSCWRKVVM